MFVSSGTSLVFSSILLAVATTLFLSVHSLSEPRRATQICAAFAANGLAALLTSQLLDAHWQVLAPLSVAIVLSTAMILFIGGISFVGKFVMAAQFIFFLGSMFWALSVVASSHVDPPTRSLLIGTYLLVFLFMLINLIERVEQIEVMARLKWRRPRLPATKPALTQHRKVSLHVPVHSEPPDMVMATLDTLARLDYPNYEVLVVDNNTEDPALWLPVKMHCQSLGDRFRFFHVANLSGAKAGALNFALTHTAPDAELIGVVDSDYRVDHDFISALADFFDDPSMGFVQTPQAHRDWDCSTYLRMCQWEYNIFLNSTAVSRNERTAAITLGTMGLIRRRLLEDLGGWAEWCLTEDSELALRVHARGSQSVYINTVFGRGLIPDSFRDYKTQRFRWCYGSIQELQRHFRLFLPKSFAQPSALTPAQKLSHFMQFSVYLKSLIEVLILIAGALLVAVLLLRTQSIEIAPYALFVFVSALVMNFLTKLHVFRNLGWSSRDLLGATFAHCSLEHTMAMASIAGLLTRNAHWQRTNKFRPIPDWLKALSAAFAETVLGIVLLVMGIRLFCSDHLQGLLLLLAAGGVAKGIKYLAAPAMAILAEAGMRKSLAVSRGEIGQPP